jgi:hypothetical protein
MISTSKAQHEEIVRLFGGNDFKKRIEDLIKIENSKEFKQSLEYSLRTTEWILNKVRQSNNYTKKLYNALCDNKFIRNHIFDILAEKTWAYSWRDVGGIIAHVHQKGSYKDWTTTGYEGNVDNEIKDDLLKLGWVIKGLTY